VAALSHRNRPVAPFQTGCAAPFRGPSHNSPPQHFNWLRREQMSTQGQRVLSNREGERKDHRQQVV